MAVTFVEGGCPSGFTIGPVKQSAASTYAPSPKAQWQALFPPPYLCHHFPRPEIAFVKTNASNEGKRDCFGQTLIDSFGNICQRRLVEVKLGQCPLRLP